jgi:CPA1 family monovalent cation:H+ antiporter
MSAVPRLKPPNLQKVRLWSTNACLLPARTGRRLAGAELHLRAYGRDCPLGVKSRARDRRDHLPLTLSHAIGCVLSLRFATDGSSEATTAGAIAHVLAVEAGGGLVLGLACGTIAYWGMRLIDDYPVEVLISLALVTGTYALAQKLHVSGPLAMVAAGLLIGDRGPRFAMSDQTQTYLFGLWTLIDEILNSVLFLLIGLEVLVISLSDISFPMAAAAIPIVLLARLLAVSAPLAVFAWSPLVSIRNVPFLTWAGIRGGISVALALSLPDSAAKPAILSATYAVVLFSIIVQGLTLSAVAKKSLRLNPDPGNPS